MNRRQFLTAAGLTLAIASLFGCGSSKEDPKEAPGAKGPIDDAENAPNPAKGKTPATDGAQGAGK